ncbi:MAG: CaiB/BaiF CoA-transferase family protein [Myxococcaceae bacterium]
MLPLEGLKVLDLSRLLPGPYATLVLADLGAQVDKVEDPNGGDYTRHMPPMKGDVSALFLGLNRNKRSVVVDLKSPEGVETLKKLAGHYDVLVETFRPGVMDRLGVGYEALAAVNPRLIYCSISGFGSTGPMKLRAGHDLTYIARSGVLGYGGEAGGAPAMPGVQIGDLGGSLFSVIGILAAVQERQKTGKGRFVDVSLTDSSMAFLHMHLAARMLMGSESGPLQRGREALNGGYACYGVYRTKDDRYLAVGALEPKFFQGVCAALERPDLFDEAYDTLRGGSERTQQKLKDIFATRTRAEWEALFSKHDLCVEPVLEGDELLNDPLLKARGHFVQQGDVAWLRTPLHLGERPITPPPALGEHTTDVLKECGLV